jgi:hypothetical protein
MYRKLEFDRVHQSNELSESFNNSGGDFVSSRGLEFVSRPHSGHGVQGESPSTPPM